MDNISNFYFPLNICTETQRHNLQQYYDIKIIKLPQLTRTGNKVQGSYTIKILYPYARNISPMFEIDESRYHEEYDTLKMRYDKIELPKHIYRLYTNVIASVINDRILKVNNTILNSNIRDGMIPSFILTKAQFCCTMTYMHGKPSRQHYSQNLFNLFINGSMPAYSQVYTNALSNEIHDDYVKIRRQVVFIRDGASLPNNLYYHNEYRTPLRHGFYYHADDADAAMRYSIYKSLMHTGDNDRATEVYYDYMGKCFVGASALYSYGNMSFPIVFSSAAEFDACIIGFINYASKLLFDADPTLLANVARVHGNLTSRTHFTSTILPLITYDDVPVSKNLSSDIRLTQCYNSSPLAFCGVSKILDKLRLTLAEPATDLYNGDWSIPHTSIFPFLRGFPITRSTYKSKPLIYDSTIQPLIGHGDGDMHYGLWLQKQEDESILNELLKFTNIIRPDMYQITAESMAIGSTKPIFDNIKSMIVKFKTSKINKSTAKLIYILTSMVLTNFSRDRRNTAEGYRPVYNLSVLFLGAISEPMIAITRSMGYRADGIGLIAQSPNIMKSADECNPEPYSLVISDIDFLGVGEDDFIDSIMNLIAKYTCPMAIKILPISSKLSRLLVTNRINCYFAQLPMSSGFNERWLFVNERAIGGPYPENDGFNMYFGSNYEYYVTNTIIDESSVFRPQVYSGLLTETEIGIISQYSEDCHVSQIGTADSPQYIVSGLISSKSRNRGLLGTLRQSFSTILSRSKNTQPSLSSYSANVFDVYLDSLLLEALNDYHDTVKQRIVILDIGGRSVHDLPDLFFPYQYVAVNVTRDYKLKLQLDAIYNTDISFRDNMLIFMNELALPTGSKVFVVMRNFLFALPSVVVSILTMGDFIADVKSFSNPNIKIWMNYFGASQPLTRNIPNVKTKSWTIFEEPRRFFKTLTFATYPTDDLIVGMIEPVANSVLVNPNYFSEILESNGYTLNRSKYITSMYLLNLLQIYKSK